MAEPDQLTPAHPEGGLERDGRGAPPSPAEVGEGVAALMASHHHPDASWLPSPNFWTDRLGHDMSPPSWVVLHTMVGSWQAAWSRFQQSSQLASSTYGVKLDGGVIQFVDEKDGPWTNGTSTGTGSNLESITIEHEDGGDYNGPRTPALYRASALLVRDICQRYGIPIDRQHVIKHDECTGASTACPDSLDVDGIVRMAAGTQPLPAGGDDMPLSDGFKYGLMHGLLEAVYKRKPSQQELIDFVNVLNSTDGANFGDIAQELDGNLMHPDEVRLQNETLADKLDQVITELQALKATGVSAVSDAHIAAVAAAEIQKRLQNG